MPTQNFDTEFSNASEWATMYRGHGLQVVPAMHCDPRNVFQWKRPALATWREHCNALVTDSTFAEWYGANGKYAKHEQMGMITGKASDNVGVIDLDTHKMPTAMSWWLGILAEYNSMIEPETWEQITGGGGRQILYRFPANFIIPTIKTPIGVDIRGQGGFAMLPPSQHESGKTYRWKPGCAPFDGLVADAPHWLCEAVMGLWEHHGRGGGVIMAGKERIEPVGEFNDFGFQINGREDKMFRWVWAVVCDLRRDSPIKPSPSALDRYRDESWALYALKMGSNIKGVDNEEGLRREGRGKDVFDLKWKRAIDKWDTEVARDAAQPKPERVSSQQETGEKEKKPESTSPNKIRLFDFAQLILEDIPEVPDYIEPDALGCGGFMLIGGPPKAMKSFFLQDLLVTAATGGTMLDGLFKIDRPLRVFWLQAEMNEKVLRRRAKAMTGLSPAQIDLLAANMIVSDRFKMILDENGVKNAADLIKSAFMDGEAPDIIAFDPMANLFDQENENDNAQVMKFLTQRVDAVRQLVNPMAGVILVHHANKKGPDEIRKDPFNCFRGGGSLRGYYDTGVILFKKNEDGDDREVHFEYRGGESPEPIVVKYQDDGRFKKVDTTAPPEGHSSHDIEFILSEIDRRWKNRNPFAIGMKSARLTLEVYLMQQLKMKRFEAKALIERLVGIEAIGVERWDSKRKLDGYRVLKWHREGQ